MTGTERLLEMVKDQDDMALKQTVDYLISRKDMEVKYLNQEKTLKEMCDFIRSKASSHAKNGWNYITDPVVYSWAIMYFSLPNKFLKIETKEKSNKASKHTTSQKNNVVSIEDAKQKIEQKKEVEQLNLFGGVS